MGKALKYLIIGIVIGGFAGLWAGINIGKEKPILSNPLEEPTVTDRVKWKTQELLDETSKALD
jgi:hypothetical protein